MKTTPAREAKQNDWRDRALKAEARCEQLEADRQTRSGFYVASRASVPERSAMWRALRETGVRINSSWIYEAGPGETADLAELWLRIETKIAKSAALILYVEPNDFPLKGAIVEVGIAIGKGIPVYIVAPGVVLDAVNCRPLGSWIKHPGVCLSRSLAPTIRAALAASKPEATEQ